VTGTVLSRMTCVPAEGAITVWLPTLSVTRATITYVPSAGWLFHVTEKGALVAAPITNAPLKLQLPAPAQ
jgi:hypothetical protein